MRHASLSLLLALLLSACGAESGTPLPPSDAGGDASTWPPVTTCPTTMTTMGSRFPFSACDLGTETPRFVTLEECARRNGVPLSSSGRTTHPQRAVCDPFVLFLQADIR